MTTNFLRKKGIEFSSKVKWRMSNDKNPLFITLQDKYRVREYATQKRVEAAPLLYATDDPNSIPFATLPDDYFVKANHGWQCNILCRDCKFYWFGNGDWLVGSDGRIEGSNLTERHAMTRSEVVQVCDEWMRTRHLTEEWAYQHIRPMIIVEQLLLPKADDELKDYRMYTFHGEVKAISIGSPGYRKLRRNVFLTPNWETIPLTKYKEQLPDAMPQRPEMLDAMIASAERLGEGIDFVRVDLYESRDGVRLGEMTVYPEGGYCDTPTACPEFNIWLGDQW